MSVGALEALADNRSRFLGAICPVGWIPHPLPEFSSSPLSHPDIVSDILGRISSIAGLAPGGLLQSSFPGGKGDGRLASHDRPLSPERVCSANSVQDGDSSLCVPLRLRGGFPSFHRSEGRVFPDARSSVVEEAVEVPVRRDSLLVQGPVLWTVDCPSGLHQGVCSRVCVGAVPRDSSSSVPGRLAGPRFFGSGDQKEHPGSALGLSLSQDRDKREEVRSRTLADCKLPQYDHRYWGRQEFCVPCAGREISVGGRDVLY